MSRYGSREESLGRWISVIHRYGQRFIEKKCADLDIGYGHVAFILTLNRKGGLSQEKLSEILNIDKTTTARAIKKLIELGYILRSPDSLDKRIQHLHLTAKSNDIIPYITQSLRTWTKVLSKGFTEDERRLIIGFLKRMAENAMVFREDGFVQRKGFHRC